MYIKIYNDYSKDIKL